jgi:hypothetical protein
MKASNWARILACGLVAGGIWTALSVMLLAFIGSAFLAAVGDGRSASAGGSPLFMIFANLGAGIWATWLYVALRPRYGAGLKSALAAALAWWLMSSMQSAKWVSLLAITPATIVTLFLATLPAMVMATLAGAWFYEK